MKVLLSLSVLCITLALCQAFCYYAEPEVKMINGVRTPVESCTDPSDGSRHPSGSKWNTRDCIECSCHAGERRCCARYGGLASGPAGCIAVVDPDECRYKFYRKDNPSKPCVEASETEN